jgi:hypothetical protein
MLASLAKTLRKGEPAEALALKLPVLMGNPPAWKSPIPLYERLANASDDRAVKILQTERPTPVLPICQNCQLAMRCFKLTVPDLAVKLTCDHQGS